jgi:hypothetical protein
MGVIDQRYLVVLSRICHRLRELGHPWAVTGSLGLALQEVSVEVHDVDIQTDRQGAYEIERLLPGEVVSPVKFVQSERIRSHCGQIEMDGCKIEIMGDVEKRTSDGWGKPPHLPQIIKTIRRGELIVPVLDLSYELDAYRRLNRPAMVEAIEKALANLSSPPRSGY